MKHGARIRAVLAAGAAGGVLSIAFGIALVVACSDEPAETPAPLAPDGAVTIVDSGAPMVDAAETASLTIRTRRVVTADAGPAPVLLEITPLRGGVPVRGATFAVTASGAAVSPTTERPDGAYELTLTPSMPSGEVPVEVRWEPAGSVALTATKTLLVLPSVGAQWDQPEAVPGLVNSAGYEDGIQVSPDGAWLFVSSYSPIDVFGCDGAPGDKVASAACNSAVGPYGPPERPGMFGAERIVSPSRVRNRCERLCFTEADGGDIQGVPLYPVTAFGFRRQSDGTFREPFAFGIDADGCNAPFGYAMLGKPVGSSAEVVFSVRVPGSTTNEIWTAPLTLGQRNVLASFQCVGGASRASAVTATPLAITPAKIDKGNPSYAGGLLFFDDEYTSSPPRLYVTRPDGGTLGGATFAVAVPPGVGSLTNDQRQPFFDPPTLYFTRDLSIVTSTLAGDPAVQGAWSALVSELVAENGASRVGSIIAVGEPSVAKLPDGSRELYFVYAVKTQTSLDFNAGRVRAR